jgi:hypothetical protein
MKLIGFLLFLFFSFFITQSRAQGPALTFDEKISVFIESVNSKNFESFQLYEDEVYLSTINEGTSDSVLISIIYPYFIRPNLYDFNQFEKAIKYMDFIIPKVINYYGEYSIENNLYHHARAYALKSAGFIEEEIKTREYNNNIFKKLLPRYPAQVEVSYFSNLLNLLSACAGVENYTIYQKYEDEVFQKVLNQDYSDSSLINVVYDYFIDPNIIFNQFEKAIEYMDFIIPKVINYYGEYSVENSLYHHERAYALQSLGLVEEEILTREYNNKIFEKLLPLYPAQVAENYEYNLFYLDQLYTAKNDHLNELKILIRRLDVARDKNEEFDIASRILGKYESDTVQFKSYVNPISTANKVIALSSIAGKNIIETNGRDSWQYVSFLTNIGYAYRFLDKDELFVNSLDEAFRFINPNYYKSNRDFSTDLFNICAPLSTHYLSIDNIEESLFYDMAYLEVCDDFENKILVLSGILINVSAQPGTYDSLIKKVIHQIEMDLQSDEASYVTKMDIIIGITTSFLNTEDYNMVQIWQRIKYDLMQANNATEKEMIEDYWISQAQIESKLGNPWKAREILHDCFKAVNLVSNDEYLTMLNNQATYLMSLNEVDEALVLFELQLKQIDTSQFASNKKARRDYLLFLNNLSAAYGDQKQFKQSLYYSQKALDFADRWFDRNTDLYLTVLSGHASNLSYCKGSEEEAIRMQEKCLDLSESIYGKSSTSYSMQLNNLFLFYMIHGEYQNADDLFLISYNIFRDDFIEKANGLTKKELQFYSLTFVRGQASYLAYAIERRDTRPEFYQLVINDLLRSHNLYKNRAFEVQKKSSPLLLSKYKSLQKTYFENLQLSVSEINNQEIDFERIERDYQSIESQLYREVTFDFNTEINIKNIQAKLLTDEVFIFNFLYSKGQRLKYDIELDTLYRKPQETFYDFLVITKNDIKHFHLPRLVVDYWDVFEHLQSEIQSKNILRSNTHKYLQDLIDVLINYKHIYFCPEGRFGEINLETLFDYNTNKFLLENSRVEITTPNNFINGNYRKEINVKGKKAVFFGAPQYNMDLQDYTYSDGKFGFSFLKNEGEESCYIYGVNNGKTPAYKSPLKDGAFLLLALNGTPIKKEWSQSDMYTMLQGAAGTEAEFKITNNSIKDTLVFTLKRENPKKWYQSNYAPLPFTDIEVDKCSDFLTQNGYDTEMFKGEGATETELKKIDNPSILHIATHSYYEYPENIDNKSYVIHNGFYNKSYWGNPELFGGILMAGCNDFYIEESKTGVDNGIVNSAEISQLDLSSTELVVMSSCESAKGSMGIASNLNGFMEGLQLAGARKVIASLWSVSDSKTAEFMVLFYENYAERQDASEALYQAKLKMFKKYDRAYWAPFVLIYL